MPFKSDAQRRKFYAMEDRGEISTATLKKWERETPKGKDLPERVKKAEPGPPPGWSLKEWDKHLQYGYQGNKLPKHMKKAYYLLGNKSALAALGLMTGERR
jgi:hypothetical protein